MEPTGRNPDRRQDEGIKWYKEPEEGPTPKQDSQFDELNLIDTDKEDGMGSPTNKRHEGDDMNLIKAYIGNLLYEKWFLENFTMNTDQLDYIPPDKLKNIVKKNKPIDYETNTVFESEYINDEMEYNRGLSISSDPTGSLSK